MSYRMFDYLVPNVNFFGPNAISVVGERCQLLGGKKALLVTDKGLRAIKDGAVDKTLHYLREAGIEVAIFDGVEPNPKDTNVRDGLAVFSPRTVRHHRHRGRRQPARLRQRHRHRRHP